MISEKSKKMLYRTLLVLGFTLVMGAQVCEIISDWSDVLPSSDMYRALMILGWSIGWMGFIFEPITTNQLENGPGCFLTFNLLFMIFLPLSWIWQIKHFTASVLTILAISAILTIVDIVLVYKKSRQIKTMGEEDEKKQV